MSEGRRGPEDIITVFNLAEHTIWIIRSLLLTISDNLTGETSM